MTCIVDGAYLTYRAYCAGGVEAMHRGAVSVVLDLLARDGEVWIAWEGTGGAALRRAILPDYKARRTPKPAEYHDALPALQDALSAAGVHHAWPAEGEGDDAAGVLAGRAVARGREVLLWTRDKDWMQLVDDWARVAVLRPAASGLGEAEVLSAAGVEDALGVSPSLVADYLALAGDPSDGVPGIARIGAQRAVALLRACPPLVRLVLDGRGDEAVAQVAAADATLSAHARAVADGAETLRTMVRLVELHEVDLHERRGAYDADRAAAALEAIGCGWALGRLAQVAADEWEDGAGDDWSE